MVVCEGVRGCMCVYLRVYLRVYVCVFEDM